MDMNSPYIDHNDPSSFLAVDHTQLNDFGRMLADNLLEVAPRTRFRKGDLVILREPTTSQKLRRVHIPVVMKIHLIVSETTYRRFAAAYELNRDGVLLDALEHYKWDAATMFADTAYVKPDVRERAMLYCHGYPHSFHPNTAGWFMEKHIAPLSTVCPTAPWPEVLDRQHTQYEGYETLHGVTLDLAPDRYGLGQKFHRPFDYEESTYHTLALLGLEQTMESTVHPRFYTPTIERPW